MAMVSTYTLADALGFVRSDLAAKGVKVFADAEVKRSLKRAYREFCGDLRFYQTTASESAIASQFEYGWPDLCLEIRQVYYNNVALERRSEEWLISRNPTWRSDTAGTPLRFYTVPMTKYGVHPKPSGTLTLKVEGIFVPTYPASDSTTFTLPEAYEDLLIARACAIACLRDISGFGSDQFNFFQAEYDKGIKKALGHADGGDDVVAGEDAKSTGFGLRPPTLQMP
jgi:hypothetical protein